MSGQKHTILAQMSRTLRMNLKRWDGARGVGTEWNQLSKDSELSSRAGNCLVHLCRYQERDKSRRPEAAAAFRVPLSLLLAAKCSYLIEGHDAAYASGMGLRPFRTMSEIRSWHRANPDRAIEIFLPPPSCTDVRQLRRHQLSIRNFFAWLLRRPLVGETLGEALVGLLHSMHEYRRGDDVDNIADLIRYLNEVGYLRLAETSNHALAILRLAETFRLKDLYLQALAHCVGMRLVISDGLDYQFLSLATRDLIKDAAIEVDRRLFKANNMLANFLDQELSEAYLGISDGLRAHLDRFRSFLLSFYARKLGYYPPRTFDGPTYRSMVRDFRALYSLLVDESYRSSESMPSMAVGGLCTLQLVQSFDNNNGFTSKRHPLPKLPTHDLPAQSRRLSWLPRQRPDAPHLSHVALVKASNWDNDLFQNSLVRAYRHFEEDCASSARKVDRHDKISVVDGRKIRWILIYAALQTLEMATQRPPEVSGDCDTKYVLSIARNTLVPWHGSHSSCGLLWLQTETALGRLKKHEQADQASRPVSVKMDLQPDIDYLALAQKQCDAPSRRSRRVSMPVLSIDVQAALSLDESNFCSLSEMLNSDESALTTPASITTTTSCRAESHGQEDMSEDGMRTKANPLLLAGRSASTASEAASSDISTVPSTTSMADTLDSTACSEVLIDVPDHRHRWSRQDKPAASHGSGRQLSNWMPKSTAARRRTMSTALEGYNLAAKAIGNFIDQDRRHKHAASLSYQATPLVIMEEDMEDSFVVTEETDEWAAMQAFLDGKDPTREEGGDYAWAQYADLGGLTEVR